MDLRKDIAPQTTLTFYPSHNYQTGDAVQAYTNGGTLPTPLVAAQNYFVHSINSTSLTLHANASDATSGLNPITFTDSGSGASALVKLVPATSNTGTINQITAPGLNVTDATPPTTAASAVAIVSGSVTSVQIVAAGSKYTSTPKVTFDSPLKTYSITGTTHSNKVIDGIYNVTNAAVGQTITGAGIPAGTIITAVNGSTSLVLSNSATTTSTATSFTGDITSLTHVVTNPSTLDGVAIGQPISWSGLPAGTTIVSINNTGTLSTSTITISNEATTNGTGVTFTLRSLSFTIAPTIPIGSTQTYSTATGYAVMVPDATGSTTYAVGSIVITSSGQGYTSPPSITIEFPTTGNTFTYASTLASPVLTTVTAISGQAAGQPVFGAGIPNGSVILSVTTNTITISQNATATLAAGQSGSSLVAGTTNQAQAVATLQTSSVSSIIVPDGAGGSGYLAAPIVKLTGGGGTGATATSQISSAGVVTGINVISAGTGYTSSPTIAFIPSTGVLVEFSSTGSLPSPIVAGTAYRLESPINSNTGVYTILNADYSTVNVTGTFSGNFYVNLSKAFAIGFNGIWNGDFNGLSTGQTVYLSSDYLLPTGVNNTTAYTLTKLTATTANLSAGSPLAVVTPTALGVGQGYFAVRVPGQGKPYNSLISLANVEYLSNGEIVQFSSTNSLPAPLQSGTNYTITLAGNNVSLKTSTNASVTLTNLAVGQLSMNIIRAFAPIASTSVVANNQIYDTGNEVMVRPNIGDTLPSGLSAGSYYVRAISPAAFELYDTQSNAENLSSTQGRITYSSTGNTVDSIFFVDAILPPTLVKAVLHVEKPLTVGYVSLYALDYGRSNDMALIGQYHPTEVNPKYRRIRVGSACSWVRIIYRALHPDISSIYDYIPVENARAVINAVHAVDLEDKDFFDQSRRYMELAIKYLKDQNDSFEGHAMMSIQVDGITYGDKTDPVIESGYGYGLW